ncbi:Cof-type HAD-IIB family hydrolase [Streptococcus didelphis]|uniref:Cof-type HAD-IIB family hydrolase n=1 Tax=Streptococcus didelphis TaxID=102886 RepID=A0ABY9LI78_9STRE|nr:Cof-type HAD-IIB family hydrolase [Streptococcus didelphis]WMB28533.1 Cof-type HAD-IIB family hydrolase [Streptococcus didelphis]WMB29207.1 Cof-type HAD-IIB family hydrolase [Streptococcus didelphis]
MTIKTIFLDMDGTLLNTQGRVSISNANAIKEAGFPITLVSARAPMEMKEAIDALDLKGIQIGFNGALIYRYHHDKLETFSETPIPDKLAQQVIQYIYEYFPQVSQSYYTKDMWIAYQKDAGIDYESQLTLLEPKLCQKEEYLFPKKPVFKIMLITFDPLIMTSLKENLLQLGIETIAIQQSGAYYLEITHKEAVKSKGIDYIMQLLDLKKQELAAFGDGHNDLPMLKKVGLPIAMANAHPDVLKATHVVTRSNDEDGVAYGIWQYLKGKND